jgi:HSP20 family protein
MDVYETADACMIEIDLPGFNGDEFTLTLTGTTLRIEGVKRQDKGECAMSYICLERHYGRFSRALEIPPGFDANGVRARYERGVLTVTVPRSTTDTASKGE